jgi:hypothetical protein
MHIYWQLYSLKRAGRGECFVPYAAAIKPVHRGDAKDAEAVISDKCIGLRELADGDGIERARRDRTATKPVWENVCKPQKFCRLVGQRGQPQPKP